MIIKVGKATLFSFISAWMIFQLIACSAPSAEEYEPFLNYQTTVTGHTLQSNDFPKGSITFDSSIVHIGSETFILYEVARCEINLFGELDGQGGYKRLYWIQYEGYLPNKLLSFPRRISGGPTYDYTEDPYRLLMGGRQFYTSNSFHSIEKSEEYLSAANGPEDSDFAHVTRLLAKNGVNINAEVLGVRMVYLDPSRKKELMIIYYEVMDGDKVNFDKLDKEGEESSLWETVSAELRKRASEGILINFEDGE